MIEHTLRDFKLILANSTKQGADIIKGQTLQAVFIPNNWVNIHEIHNYLNEAQAKTINDALHLGLGPFYRSNFLLFFFHFLSASHKYRTGSSTSSPIYTKLFQQIYLIQMSSYIVSNYFG